VPLERSVGISRLAALAALRPTQGVYHPDPTLLRELLETPADGGLPGDGKPARCSQQDLGIYGHADR
jgi:hypothetical protein